MDRRRDVAQPVCVATVSLGRDAYWTDEYNGERYNFNTPDRKGANPSEWPADLQIQQRLHWH